MHLLLALLGWYPKDIVKTTTSSSEVFCNDFADFTGTRCAVIHDECDTISEDKDQRNKLLIA